MKAYSIKVSLNKEKFIEICEDWDEFFDTKKEFEIFKTNWLKTNGSHKIVTFEEWTNLVNTVSSLTDGCYCIYNKGEYIVEE